MMNRLNATSCPCSLRLSKLSMLAEAWWNRMHLAADDWGVFQANPRILKGKLWPLRDDMTIDMIQSLLNEYTETGLVHQFVHKDEKYGFFLGWFEHQKIRYMSARIYPAPPESEITFKINHKTNSKGEKVERFGSDCVEVFVHCAHIERTTDAHRLPVTVTVTETVTETVTGLKDSANENHVCESDNQQPSVGTVEKPKKTKPKKEPKIKSTAVCAYRDVFNLWPNKTQEEEIDATVNGQDQVARWSQICHEWALRGFKPTSVRGMLDWFKGGVPAAGPKHATGKVNDTLGRLADRIQRRREAASENG